MVYTQASCIASVYIPHPDVTNPSHMVLRVDLISHLGLMPTPSLETLRLHCSVPTPSRHFNDGFYYNDFCIAEDMELTARCGLHMDMFVGSVSPCSFSDRFFFMFKSR